MLKRKIKALYFLVLGFKESNYNDSLIYLEQAHKLFYGPKLNLKDRTPKTYNNGL